MGLPDRQARVRKSGNQLQHRSRYGKDNRRFCKDSLCISLVRVPDLVAGCIKVHFGRSPK